MNLFAPVIAALATAFAFLPAAAPVATPAPSPRVDEGMWTLDNPPLAELEARHGFVPGPEWLEHLQKSAVRFSTGGSGSLVSSEGLVMTNHHVGADILEKLSTPERNLMEDGFVARSSDQELPCPDLELDVLWTIEDVTARVQAVAEGLSSAEANTARRQETTRIREEAQAATGMHYEVVTLYKGGLYHLYGYKRYTDVRLVMAPETQAAFYGGDTDNFEYPRYCLDVCFFRIYEDGAPLAPEHFLRWSLQGAQEDDLIFVAGHPGSTQRLYTVAHLEFLRDVRHPLVLQYLWRNEVKDTSFGNRSAENMRIVRGDLFGTQNGRKAITGTLAGLHDPAIFEAKRAAEKALRAAVAADPQMKADWGGAWSDLERAEALAAELYARILGAGTSGLRTSSDLYGMAINLVRLAEERPKENAERLPEFADAALDSLFLRLSSPAPIYPELEIHRLEKGLSYMAEMFGGDDEQVRTALAGRSPAARAAELVGGTKLADPAERKRLADGGREAIEASDDPLILLARSLDPAARALRTRWEDEVQAVETEAYAKIAAAQFAIQGQDVYPDATFTLRLAYGVVKGWNEAGREIPPFTQVGGLYERAAERAGDEAYRLTDRWQGKKDALELDTPYNFVATADIIGGNSGSPVVNRAGEVVGLIFDGNLHSLVLSIAYTEEVARCVSVDARGILESLGKVYEAGELVEELSRDAARR